MATFLFWNIKGKPLVDEIARLVVRHDVDVLLLAECVMRANIVLPALNRDGATWSFAAPKIDIGRAKIQIYVRLKRHHVQELVALPHATIREFRFPELPSILLAAVHLPSKLWNDSGDQNEICRELSVQLRQSESDIGHRRLVVVGDFNVNPFETGMIAPTSLNAEASRWIARKGARKIDKVSYPYFYNPMWNYFGGATVSPGGTYFYGGTKRVRVSWNIFDQVLLRPDLLEYFKTEELEILTGDGTRSFLDGNGIPNKKQFSDHLPVVFKLDSPTKTS